MLFKFALPYLFAIFNTFQQLKNIVVLMNSIVVNCVALHTLQSATRLYTRSIAIPDIYKWYFKFLIKFNFTIFADDTNAFLSDKFLETLYTRAGNELESLSEWFKANKLSLNLSKTNYIIFRSKKKILPVLDSSIKIDNKEITQVTTTNFLGVYVDEHLTFNDWSCLNNSKKVAKNIGIISRIRHVIQRPILMNLYNTLILLLLQYCMGIKLQLAPDKTYNITEAYFTHYLWS